ncbi:L-amino acid amidase [Grifola frondosa]|uniref:L-amino acid amidase n=1 Tax=Grifola frondosa TaxID=5627 RepID=A0A1C7LS73_GRIFR|nr:L-amino acid amidase [Grifola frondosa]
MSQTTGTNTFTHGHDTFQTWYKVVGDLKSGGRPLVTLHGGPGLLHHYMLPHIDLCASHAIPVIFYDQVGNGKSSHVKDKPKEFWQLDLFMDELDSLLEHLGIRDNFDLLGHSWGGMFASHYAATRCPPGLRHLVIVGAGASMELWLEGLNNLLRLLPQDMQDVLKKHEDDGTTDSQEYRSALKIFYKKHICSLDPWPEFLLKSFSIVNEDPTVNVAMFGDFFFTCNGTMKTWSIVGKLENISSSTFRRTGEVLHSCWRIFDVVVGFELHLIGFRGVRRDNVLIIFHYYE